MDEQTGVAKDQKHTPKKPYNTDMAICMSSDLGSGILSESTYDPRVVTDKIPDKQLHETRHQNDEKQGICGSDPITKEPSEAASNPR